MGMISRYKRKKAREEARAASVENDNSKIYAAANRERGNRIAAELSRITTMPLSFVNPDTTKAVKDLANNAAEFLRHSASIGTIDTSELDNSILATVKNFVTAIKFCNADALVKIFDQLKTIFEERSSLANMETEEAEEKLDALCNRATYIKAYAKLLNDIYEIETELNKTNGILEGATKNCRTLQADISSYKSSHPEVADEIRNTPSGQHSPQAKDLSKRLKAFEIAVKQLDTCNSAISTLNEKKSVLITKAHDAEIQLVSTTGELDKGTLDALNALAEDWANRLSAIKKQSGDMQEAMLKHAALIDAIVNAPDPSGAVALYVFEEAEHLQEQTEENGQTNENPNNILTN